MTDVKQEEVKKQTARSATISRDAEGNVSLNVPAATLGNVAKVRGIERAIDTVAVIAGGAALMGVHKLMYPTD